MDTDILGATSDFRKLVIAMLLCTDWMVRYGAIIQPEYFPSDVEKDLMRHVNDHYNQYGDVPTEAELRNRLDGDGDTIELLDDVIACFGNDIRYAADVALDFARLQAMKLAILESVDCIKAGDLAKPMGLVREAQQIGQDRLGLGMDLVDDAESWVYDELHGRRFPTGWPTIDGILGGGLVPGEYGLVMTPPGMGKTTMLINIGFGMAGLIGSANVLNITYEMPEQKYLKRYAARVVGIRLHRGGAEAAFIRSLRKRASQRLRGKLRVVRPPDNTIDGIRRMVDSLAAEGFETEALIVDYPDLMRPLRKRKELRFELADISRDLRDLGTEYDMPVWGASQAGRHAIYKEIIHIGDIAEAIEKAAIADLIISLCQTKDEMELGHGRIYIAKVRDAEDKFIVPVKVDFANQAITQRRELDV